MLMYTFSDYIKEKYLWENTDSIKESKLGDEGIYGDWNWPTRPKRIMCIGKAHKKAYGLGAECYRVILRENHLN